jgi:colanic acid/amylovoran biosynthesis glycosyltransferase
MRVAMFLDEFPTLTETFILNQITGLLDRGHEVDLFARFRGAFPHVHADVARYDLRARTLYLEPEPRQPLRRALEALRLLLTTSRWWSPRGIACAWRILAARRRGERLPTLDLIRLASVTLGRRYDVIHCQYATIGRRVLPLIELGLVSGALVTSVRGHDITDEYHTRAGYQRLFAAGRRFLPVSGSLRALLVGLGCPAGKIEILHSGIDCTGFRYRERCRRPGEPTVLVSVARHVEMKGLEYGIRAVAAVIGSGREVEYHLVGDGPLRGRLEALIDELGIGDHVHLHGWRPHDQVVALLERAHVFLMPSVTTDGGQAEGIPNALKEAMAMGLAVVATRHGGIPELVEDGSSGWLVPERDVEALASRLQAVTDAPGSWAAISRAARHRVEEAFDRERLNDRLVAIYAAACRGDVGGGQAPVSSSGEDWMGAPGRRRGRVAHLLRSLRGRCDC